MLQYRQNVRRDYSAINSVDHQRIDDVVGPRVPPSAKFEMECRMQGLTL